MRTDAFGSEIDREARPLGLASLALPMLMASMDTSIANVALPTLAKAFGATFAQVQWVVVGYLLSLTSLIVGAGHLGDMIGRKRLLIAGLALFCATSILCSLAPGLPMLIAFRTLQGLGAAIVIAMTMALAGDTVPEAQVGRAMGVLGTMSALGTSLGPSLGGLLIEALGWRAIFLVNVPVSLLAIILALPAPSGSRPPAAVRRRGYDLRGAVLLAAALAMFAVAMTSGPPVLLVVTVICTGLFVRAERRAPAPLVRLAALGDPLLSAGLATSLLVAAVMMTTLVVGPFYLGHSLALEPTSVGFVMAAGPLGAAVAGIPAGRIVDQWGSRRLVLAALSAMSAGLAALASAPGIAGYVASITIVTIGYAVFQAANNASVMRGASDEERGVVSGLLSLSRNLGLITGASAMGALFAFTAGTGEIASSAPAQVAAATQTTFAVAALLAIAAMLIAAGSTFSPRPANVRVDTVCRSRAASRSSAS